MKKNSQFDQYKHVKFTAEVENKAIFLSVVSTPLRTTSQNDRCAHCLFFSVTRELSCKYTCRYPKSKFANPTFGDFTT